MVRQLKLILWNACGLSARKNELQVFADDHNADILLLTETHLRPEQTCNIRGYHAYRADRAGPIHVASGGAAVYVHRRLLHRQIPLNTALEAAGVALQVGGRELQIHATYVAPAAPFQPHDLDHLLDQGPSVIVGGDFNAKHTTWGSRVNNARGRSLRAHLRRRDDTDVAAPEHPTYYPTRYNAQPDILDIFLCKGLRCFGAMNVCVFDELSSDHNPIMASLDMVPVSGIPRDNHRFRTDWGKYAAYLETRLQAAPAADSPAELDALVSNLHGVLMDALMESRVPIPAVATSRDPVPTDIYQAIAFKRRLRRSWQRTRHPAARRAFNRQCEVVKTLLRTWRTDSWTTYLSNLDTVDGSAWKTARILRNDKTTRHPLQGHHGLAYTAAARAEVFADTMEDQFQPHPNTFVAEHVEYVENSNAEFFVEAPADDLPPIAEDEVRAAIHAVKQRKSPGIDGVGAKALHSAPPGLIVILAFIFNAVLRLHHFPTSWKTAKVAMIPKPGKSRLQPQNFRPISLLPTISKVFERLLLCRLTPYLEGFIRPEQFGFRRDHSTTLQLIRVVNQLVDNANSYLCSVAVLLDVSKAFDRVWHEGLLYKLRESPLPTSAVHLLKSYLSSRTFRIAVDGELSTLRHIRAGVPQGSVLGPVLYLLYTNDMPLLPGVTLSLYADDAMFISKSMNLQRAVEVMQQMMDALSPWLARWRIAINTEKSNAVCFKKRRRMPRTRPAEVVLNGQPISWRTSVKYLGVWLDARLNFGAHVKEKISEANKLRGFLLPLLGRCSILPVRVKTQLYLMILRAVVMYASTAWWALCCQSNKAKLQSFQNKTLRNISRQPWFVKNTVIAANLEVSTLHEYARSTADKLLLKASESTMIHIREITLRNGPPEDYRKRPAAILDDPP